MIGAIAGIVDPSADAERVAALVRAALTRDGEPEVVSSGPLTVAWTAPARLRRADGRLVLVDGWLADGPDPLRLDPADDVALAALRGDFTLLIWDERRAAGALVTDHLGARAPAYAGDGSRLRFGSEVAHVLALLPTRPAPDQGSLASWLRAGIVPHGRSLYEGVAVLGGGSVLGLGSAAGPVRRYWTPRHRPPATLAADEAAAHVRVALGVALRRRAAPGGATGVLLSGGLDSGAVAAAGIHDLDEERRPRRSYSAVFPSHAAVDESALIATLVDDLGLEASVIAVEHGSVLGGALPYLERWGLPPVSPNLAFWLPLLGRAREQGTSVMLDGEGGDEVFGLALGLPADLVRRGRLLAAARLVRALPGAPPASPGARIATRFLSDHGLRMALPLALQRAARRMRGGGGPPWLGERAVRLLAAGDGDHGWKRHDGPRWWAHLADAIVLGEAPRTLYEHSRRRARLAGVEHRHPLSDIDLVELMLSIDPRLRWDRRYSRPVLRAALGGALDDAIRLRPDKSSFDEFFHAMLDGPDRRAVEALLTGPGSQLGDLVDRDAVRALVARRPADLGNAAARGWWGSWLWRLAGAELFLRLQEGSGSLADGLGGELQALRYTLEEGLDGRAVRNSGCTIDAQNLQYGLDDG